MTILFRDIADVRQYITVDISSDLDVIAPYLKQAEKYIREITGDELMDAMLSGYETDNLTPEQEKLLPYIQLPLANFGYWLSVEKLNVNVGNSGITVTVGSNQEIASQWRVEQFKASLEQSAYAALEELLKFLENNVSDYPEWRNSPAYSYNRQFFVNNAREFNDITFLNISRLDFLKIRPYIRLAEDEIRQVVCDELFSELKNEILHDSVSAENQVLLGYIRPAVCYMAYWQWTEKENFSLQGRKYMERLRDYLSDNAGNYPLYQNSACYEEKTSLDWNDEDKGTIVSGLTI